MQKDARGDDHTGVAQGAYGNRFPISQLSAHDPAVPQHVSTWAPKDFIWVEHAPVTDPSKRDVGARGV